jgi:hypothetical protein
MWWYYPPFLLRYTFSCLSMGLLVNYATRTIYPNKYNQLCSKWSHKIGGYFILPIFPSFESIPFCERKKSRYIGIIPYIMIKISAKTDYSGGTFPTLNHFGCTCLGKKFLIFVPSGSTLLESCVFFRNVGWVKFLPITHCWSQSWILQWCTLCCLGAGTVPVPDTGTGTGYGIFRKINTCVWL